MFYTKDGKKENDVAVESTDHKVIERPLLAQTKNSETNEKSGKNNGHKMAQILGSDKGKSAITSSDYAIYIADAKDSFKTESACQSRCKEDANDLKERMKRYLNWEAWEDHPAESCPRDILINVF